jgi:hypothetical protein
VTTLEEVVISDHIFLTNWAVVCSGSVLFLRLVSECCRYLVELLGLALDQSTRDKNKQTNKAHLHTCHQTQESLLLRTQKVYYHVHRSQPSVHIRHQANHHLRPVLCVCVCACLYVHSVQQNSSILKFRTSPSESEVTYSCHHNSSRFTFPIFLHS